MTPKEIIITEARRAIKELDEAINSGNKTLIVHNAGVAWGVWRVALALDMLTECGALNAAIARANKALFPDKLKSL